MIERIIGDYHGFIYKVTESLKSSGIDFADLKEMDHLSYRVANFGEYENARKSLLDYGEIITENIINGRPIAVFRLNDLLISDYFAVNCLELPAPKAGSDYKSGLEHAEFVVEMPLKDFITKYPSLMFDTKEMDRENNPAIVLKLKDFIIKFHTLPLLKVALIQKETGKL